MQNKKNWTPLPKIYRHPPFTIEAPGYEKVDGETIPRWNVACKDTGLKTTPEEGIATVFDIVTRGAAKFGNAKLLGSRKLIKIHKETRKVKKIVDGKEQEVDKDWHFFEMGPYTYMSYIEYEKMILQVGAGLRQLGMQAGDRVHIFAATSAYWLGTAHAAFSQSMPIVTAYDTLGEEGLKHSLQQAKAKAIFVDSHLLKKLINPLKEAKDIQIVIYNSATEPKPDDKEKLQSAHPHLTVLSFEDVRKRGEEHPVDPVPPKPEDLCCIMYTSGSTGAPKGVLLKHKNVVAAVAGADGIVGPYLGPGDRLIAYLPLAHIFELLFETAVMYWGLTMGYGSIKTLSDASMRNCHGDIKEFKPSVLVGVPAVWESLKKGIINTVNGMNIIVRNMFWSAINTKSFLISTGIPGTAILDSVVLKNARAATGGRLRICLNGGGPIAKETQRFLSLAITPLINGYGLTETSAMGAIMDPAAWTDSALGEIPPSAEVKLIDYADAGYFAANNPPQGEICIRGPSVTEGYLDLESENKQAFTSDGWFKTGDIGEFDHMGHLTIIDRKKNLVKTLNGEYIALEKLEAIYRSAPIVQDICVYAAADKVKPIAIIVPAESPLNKLASDNGIQGDGVGQLVHHKKLNDIVLKQLQSAGRQGHLAGFEIVDGVVMDEEVWTSANGLLTSAQKINRKGILSRNKKQVDEAYGKAS